MNRISSRAILTTLLLIAAHLNIDVGYGQVPHITLTPQESGTDVLLVAASPVNDDVVWVSGAGGTVLRTEDGGNHWVATTVPGADSLQFRDIHGVDANTAYILSAGVGQDSRIYKTGDGGQNWQLQFTNPGPGGFFDCMDFWDADHGIAFSDSDEGSFLVVTTEDGGEHWTFVDPAVLPAASEGEGSFAASGTCLQTIGDQIAVIGTGAGASARLLRSEDRGRSWTAYETPITDGTPTSGISSLSFVDAMNGFAFGLELTGDDGPIQNAIQTSDGGETWKYLESFPQLPDVYGGAQVPESLGSLLVVTGPKGIDYSANGGRSWTSLSKLDHWGIAFSSASRGWATGPSGRITKLTVASDKP